MSKEFYSIEEIEKYYDEVTNTYVFEENGEYIDLVVLNFDLNIEADIDAKHIKAWNIDAWNIDAWDITAYDINAWDINTHNISYYAVCYAYNNIKCKSIKGRRKNAKHFVLDGKLEVEK